jgi:hypothetical protein
MAEAIEEAILRLAEGAGERGVGMGAIVDTLVAEGFEEKEIEQAIWRLMQHRRLTPTGFVARTIRRRGPEGKTSQRVYEFMLIPWSPALDRQLDLTFEGDAGE